MRNARSGRLIVGALVLSMTGGACKEGDSESAEPRIRPEVAIRSTRGTPFADDVLLPWMEYYGIPGLSIALVENDELQWAKGYGVLDRATGAPVTTESVFQAASISKPVAAVTTLLVLRQRGVGLDDDVSRFLASWQLAENSFTAQARVTPRLLLGHAAGVNVHGFLGYTGNQALPSLRQTLDGSAPANNEPIRVTAVPGRSWIYSGGGHQVAQQLVEDVAGGESFADLAERLVLRPVGMVGSSHLDPLPGSAVAAAHDADGRRLAEGWHRYPETAAAGLWATPTDLARFAIALQRSYRGEEGALLPPDVAVDLFAAQRPTGTAGESMGLGVFLNGAGGTFSFYHGGGNPGYRCHMVGYLNAGSALVMMTNSESGDRIFQQIGLAIQDAR